MKAPAILIPAIALLLSWRVTGGQRPQLLDPSDTQSAPEAIQRLPLDPEARRTLEKSLGAHDFAGAESLLLKEIERNPKSPGLLTFVGGVFFLDGKYLNSAVAMKKAEALAPLDDHSRFTLAMAYITLNHRDWARPELETLAGANPRTALYPYWLSRLDYDAMDFPSAIGHAQKAVELDPSFTKAHDSLGLCYEAVGKYEEALSAYGQAVRLSQKDRPCSPWPPLDLGALLVKLDRLGEADESLGQSLQCDPKLPRAHYELGHLLEKRQQNDQAVLELKQAASLDPTYAEPYYLLGRIYQREGDTRKAAEAWATFQKLEKAEPRDRPH